MSFPKAKKVQIPKPYTHSTATDIRKTIKAEQARIKAAAACVPLRMPAPTPEPQAIDIYYPSNPAMRGSIRRLK